MNLPNGDRAFIDDRKLWAYVLSPTHPHGSTHAFLFKRLLGIDLSNWHVLKDHLLTAAREAEARAGRSSPYGQRFEIRSKMTSERGVYTILSVWLIRNDDDRPALVTAYIE